MIVRLAAALAACATLCLYGCGAQQATPAGPAAPSAQAVLPAAHPQAVQPVAGAAPATPTVASATVSAGSGNAQPVSDATVRAELAASGLTASPTSAELTSQGLAVAPIAAPAAVQSVIEAGNQIAHLPYIWGGGHGTYEDNGYDCSGSLSFVLSAAGLLNTTMTSGELESWGKPGPGKWITVFAAAGHTFMYVAGLRFDTVALAETGTRWSNRSADEPDLATFVVRHPAGL